VNLVDFDGNNWYTFIDKEGNKQIKYYEGQYSESELKSLGYTDLGYTYEENGKYYSLFGITISDKSTAAIYKSVDNLLISYGKYLKRDEDGGTEVAFQRPTDISVEGGKPGKYIFSYQGNSFKSLSTGSFFSVTSNNTINYRGVVINGSTNVIVDRFPTYSKPFGGYNQGNDDGMLSGYYLTSTSTGLHNSYNHIVVRFDKKNAQCFIQSFNNLFHTNLSVK